MATSPRRPARAVLLGLGLVVALLAAPRVGAEPEDAPQGTATTVYRNTQLGLTASTPEGWTIVADKTTAPTSWKRLATFHDKDTDAQAVLSVRPRRAATLDDLMGMVRKDWEKTQDRLPMSAMRKVEASALSPVAKVIVDGSFVRKGEAKKSAAGVPEPPSNTSYKVQATYYLGPGNTYLLYATAQQTHWSRLRAGLDSMRESLRFDEPPAEGPTGEGSYRNDHIGFACRFPKGYTVVAPQRENHLVQFEGVSRDDAVLGVYAFGYDQSAAADAERLVAYYEGDKGGTAAISRTEVSGQEAQLVKAKAMITGTDTIIMIAILKRGDDCFRLRAEFPVGAEAKGTAVFTTFVESFRLGNAPK